MFGRIVNGGLGFSLIVVTGCLVTATIPTMPFVVGAFAIGAVAGARSSHRGESADEFNESIQNGIKNNLYTGYATHVNVANSSYNPSNPIMNPSIKTETQFHKFDN